MSTLVQRPERAGRRERWSIVGAVLAGIEAQGRRDGGARLSPLASHANVAFDRLKVYLVELEAAGLIEQADSPRLTARGRSFLSHYHRWMATLGSFGLAPASTEVAYVSASPGPQVEP